MELGFIKKNTAQNQAISREYYIKKNRALRNMIKNKK